MHLSLDMRDITTRVKVFCILNESGHFHMYFKPFLVKIKDNASVNFLFQYYICSFSMCNNM